MDPWWTQQQAGVLGGLVGGVIVGGLFGGIGGGLGGPLAPKGLCKNLVVGFYIFGIAFGLALLGVGLYALIVGQPFHVWFWPVQAGGLLALLYAILLPTVILRAYRMHDARRLAAEELRRA